MYGPIPSDFMTNTDGRLNSVRFHTDRNCFDVLDQLLLPHEINYVTINNCDDAFLVIKSMQVRGAPLIAIVAVRALLLEISSKKFKHEQDFDNFIKEKVEFLLSSRPTAVNLRNALDIVSKACLSADQLSIKVQKTSEVIMKLYDDEQEENRRLIWNGFQEVLSLRGKEHKYTIMTICNTGSLATVSWGTALGVIMALHRSGNIEIVYALETRPYNQGIRLTATELKVANVPFKIISDGMSGWTMKTKKVDAILVGADQVALNGDTANKIGTYTLSVLANYHKIPFYPVVPFTTINCQRETGDDIPIEERPATEFLTVNGTAIGDPTTPVWNPAFDVTPGHLITKIITDFGNFAPSDLKKAVQHQMMA